MGGDQRIPHSGFFGGGIWRADRKNEKKGHVAMKFGKISQKQQKNA
ncbi:MAG: hypothetical protein RBT03_09705 [Kiritimatiellia bacterium]|jgi:hypothetical protein|nr:hypothetical protein [Kiritimatiellia bacterium]